MENLEPHFLEFLILKVMEIDKLYTVMLSNVFEQRYFDNPSVGKIFNFSKSYIDEYKTLPPRDIIINSLNNDINVKKAFEEADCIDFNISGNYDYLLQQTNNYLKNQAIKTALLDSVDIVERGQNIELVRENVEKALTKDLKINLGLNYFNQLGERLTKIFNATDNNRMPTYYSSLDELINGGFPPFTLSVICARIHGFKCVNKNTKITIKNKKTEFIEDIRIQEFFDRFDSINKHIIENDAIFGLEGLKKKYTIRIDKESRIISNYQVFTDKGFIDIDYAIKTIPLKKYIIYFTSGNIIECADKHAFIDIEYNKITADKLNIGDLIKVNYIDDGFDEIFNIIETEEYEEMYDLSLSNHHLYYTNGILSHNSNTMANFAARQVLNGHNVVLLTLEMSEDMFAQRFDSIYSLLDINRMYLGDNKRELMRKLGSIKRTENRGELIIKQFPTGVATIRDFRIFLRELILRGIDPSIVYVDYINLMKSSLVKDNGLYSTVKAIAEELRSLSFEFEVPFVSVSQLNREGSFVGFEELDFNYIAESMGLPATCDFMGIIGQDEDSLIYESELHNKIVKNRLGGRVGEIWKCYYDSRTLKMYDENEMDIWIADSQLTGDDRNPYVRQPRGRETRRGRIR